jgi:hypothetical protein
MRTDQTQTLTPCRALAGNFPVRFLDPRNPDHVYDWQASPVSHPCERSRYARVLTLQIHQGTDFSEMCDARRMTEFNALTGLINSALRENQSSVIPAPETSPPSERLEANGAVVHRSAPLPQVSFCKCDYHTHARAGLGPELVRHMYARCMYPHDTPACLQKT